MHSVPEVQPSCWFETPTTAHSSSTGRAFGWFMLSDTMEEEKTFISENATMRGSFMSNRVTDSGTDDEETFMEKDYAVAIPCERMPSMLDLGSI
jgi:hypothetical protein